MSNSNSYPTRSNSHQLEELSERFFVSLLPRNWAAYKPGHDYGVDLQVDLFEGEQATGLELLVQLKASALPSDNETETVNLRITTYNHLWDKLPVVMLVKYIESENEAYWILFRDIPAPPQDQASFTIRIPRSNKLSDIAWSDIQDYVRSVTNIKLTAARKSRLKSGGVVADLQN